jgi:hypothetical protein
MPKIRRTRYFANRCYILAKRWATAGDPRHRLEPIELQDTQLCTKMSAWSGFLNVPDRKSNERVCTF